MLSRLPSLSAESRIIALINRFPALFIDEFIQKYTGCSAQTAALSAEIFRLEFHIFKTHGDHVCMRRYGIDLFLPPRAEEIEGIAAIQFKIVVPRNSIRS